jgi:hypothetical protein
MQTSTLRPGLLVALSTTIVGNVTYKRQDIEPDHITDDGAREAAWNTRRRVEDAAESERATEVRSKCRSIVTSVCSRSAFTLLCPTAKRPELDAAIKQARDLAEDFNRSATLSRVDVSVWVGEIAADDVEAVKQINKEVRQLIDDMAQGMAGLDVDRVREAADKARAVSGMLTPDAQDRIAVAIQTARSVARQIVKAGENAAIEIDVAAIRKVQQARTAFIDIDTPAVDTATPALEARGIDFDDNETPPQSTAPTQAVQFDL